MLTAVCERGRRASNCSRTDRGEWSLAEVTAASVGDDWEPEGMSKLLWRECRRWFGLASMHDYNLPKLPRAVSATLGQEHQLAIRTDRNILSG